MKNRLNINKLISEHPTSLTIIYALYIIEKHNKNDIIEMKLTDIKEKMNCSLATGTIIMKGLIKLDIVELVSKITYINKFRTYRVLV